MISWVIRYIILPLHVQSLQFDSLKYCASVIVTTSSIRFQVHPHGLLSKIKLGTEEHWVSWVIRYTTEILVQATKCTVSAVGVIVIHTLQ